MAENDKKPKVLFDSTWLKFTRILITGPQRSGTRICARIIAHDLNYTYIDEILFSVNHEHTFKKILSEKTDIVIHCPGMCHIIEKFSTPSTAIIFLLRPTDEILASQKRIKWVNTTELANYSEYQGPICERKLKKFREIQEHQCHNPFYFLYMQLSTHKLWIPAEKRLAFNWKQTTI